MLEKPNICYRKPNPTILRQCDLKDLLFGLPAIVVRVIFFGTKYDVVSHKITTTIYFTCTPFNSAPKAIFSFVNEFAAKF